MEKLGIDDLLKASRSAAVHLEMRDAYVPSDPSYLAFVGGPPFDRAEREAHWHGLVGPLVARGVRVRRARIVSEPVTDYIAFEHSVTRSMNVAAGEEVRWLPRTMASDLLLPGNDYWVFDDRLVRFGHFSGVGEILGHTLSEDPAVVKQCAAAFEAVWERAVPHESYEPRR
ncbi:DUF6879 family protein [Actinocorallia sp. A-T 12471]|uniref:DUF6879 family protein n=1 Tax=Actinocorallia sp. A-T 12471 TaxID=3089813 RepID=UPI0029D22ABE|nr:DUF6879 family protein [Actinocorallia sp. A-T 12471]MDX6745096.1 hypothetical protein [Actinocorallia sp. A-T 12471]